MNTTIVLVRHGETEWNALGKFQGSTDIPLSQNGKLQAEYLKERFNDDKDIQAIYSSPLTRAKDTAKAIASSKNLEVNICEDLTEINFGIWEGLTFKEIIDKYPKESNLWLTDPINAPLCGGDLSIKNASIRAKRGILNIVNAHPGEKVITVAHGGIIKAALIGLFNWDMTMYTKMFLGNTSVSIIRFNDDLKPVLVSFNDTTHLK